MTTTRHIELQGAFNVRDLGGYRTATGGETAWRTFLRADALHELTPVDIETLLGLGLATVIDLRSDGEIARQPSRFAAHDAVAYTHIPLFDGLAPVDAFITGTGSFSLSARYIDAVEHCRPALAKVAHAIAGAPDGVVLFNCTAGKDRTGIVAALLLSLAGVGADDIAADYALTATLARPLMDRLKMQAMTRGLDEATSGRLLSSEDTAMRQFLRHVEDRHGGFRRYLSESGGAPAIALIERRMTPPVAAGSGTRLATAIPDA